MVFAVAAPSAAKRESTCYSDCLITYLPHNAVRPLPDHVPLGTRVTWLNDDTNPTSSPNATASLLGGLGFSDSYNCVMSAGIWKL